VASVIRQTAEKIANNLVREAKNIADVLHDKADRIREYKVAHGSIGQEVEVSPDLRTVVTVASVVTGVAATLATKTGGYFIFIPKQARLKRVL